MLAQRTAGGVGVLRSRSPGRRKAGGLAQDAVGERDDVAQPTPVEQAGDVARRRLGDPLLLLRGRIVHPCVLVGRSLLVNRGAVDGVARRLVGSSHRPSLPSDVRTPTPFPLPPRGKRRAGGPHTGVAGRDWDNGW